MEKLYKRTTIETREVVEVTEPEIRAELERFADTIDPWDMDGRADKEIAANTEFVLRMLKNGEKDPMACSTDIYEFSPLD